MWPRKPLPACSILLLLPQLAFAAEFEEQMGGNQLAMGWTAIANPTDNAAVTVNPGLIPLTERYRVFSQLSLDVPSISWGTSLMDARTSAYLAGGIAVNSIAGNPPIHPDELPGWVPQGQYPTNQQRLRDLTFALAAPFWERRIGVGVNGTLSFVNHERLGGQVTGNMDAGVGFQPVDWMSMGLVGRNLLPIPDQGNRPAALGGGFRFVADKIGSVAVEAESKLETLANPSGLPLRVGAGAEARAGGGRFRAGYRYDGPAEQHWATAGVGLASEKGGVDYGIAIPTQDFDALNMVHQISLRMIIVLPGDEDPFDDAPWENGQW